jgi:putative tryptophan/tyrosine transport system substrate-binding protein
VNRGGRFDVAGDFGRLPDLSAELVSLLMDVIVVSNGSAAVSASRASSTIPIVAGGSNIAASGLVANLARPEGNITGVTTNSVESVGKWVELLKETLPGLYRMAVVLDLSGPAAQAFLSKVQHVAESLQLDLQTYDLGDIADLATVLTTAKDRGADGVLTVSGGVLGGGSNPQIAAELQKSGLPAVAEPRDFAVSGGLLAHGASTVALARRSASYARILNGAKPSDLPVELPTTFNIVNLKNGPCSGFDRPNECPDASNGDHSVNRRSRRRVLKLDCIVIKCCATDQGG